MRADLASFENALLEYGWLDSHRNQYAQDRYALARRRCFAVRDGFPRLIPGHASPWHIREFPTSWISPPAGRIRWMKKQYGSRWHEAVATAEG